MNVCDPDKLINVAKKSLDILTTTSELTKDNYSKFKEARGKPLERIIQCHQDKMKEQVNKVETHTENTDIHNFEKKN